MSAAHGTSPKTDWLRLELRVRDVLYTWNAVEKRNAAHPEDNHPTVQALRAVQALREISDIIGQETGRGFPLDH
jgi:hypothetical protein